MAVSSARRLHAMPMPPRGPPHGSRSRSRSRSPAPRRPLTYTRHAHAPSPSAPAQPPPDWLSEVSRFAERVARLEDQLQELCRTVQQVLLRQQALRQRLEFVESDVERLEHVESDVEGGRELRPGDTVREFWDDVIG